MWITFNEPWVFIALGYGIGMHAPGQADPGVVPYKCAHNVIRAHSKAYHMYNEEFRSSQNGKHLTRLFQKFSNSNV